MRYINSNPISYTRATRFDRFLAALVPAFDVLGILAALVLAVLVLAGTLSYAASLAAFSPALIVLGLGCWGSAYLAAWLLGLTDRI